MSEAKSIQTILESQYTDGIDTILSYELDDKDNIVGQFRDGQKIYAFKVNSDAIAYKLIRTRDFASFLESDEPLDFKSAPAKSQPAKQKNCVKGTPCKGQCINKDKRCRTEITGIAAKAADYLDAKVPKAKAKTPAAAKSSGRKIPPGELRAKSSAKSPKTFNDFIEVGNSALNADAIAAIDKHLKNPKDKVAKAEAVAEMKNLRESLLTRMPKAEAALLAKSAAFGKDEIPKISGQTVTSINDPDTRKKVVAIATEFYQMTGRGSETVKTFTQDSKRAFASSDKKVVGVGREVAGAILFHEMAHHLEYGDSAVREASRKWIESRASNKPQKMKDITGNQNYRDTEIAHPDKFLDPYVGKIYASGTTEVASMGIERFHTPATMLKFYAQDSEHFKLTLGIIKS